MAAIGSSHSKRDECGYLRPNILSLHSNYAVMRLRAIKKISELIPVVFVALISSILQKDVFLSAEF